MIKSTDATFETCSRQLPGPEASNKPTMYVRAAKLLSGDHWGAESHYGASCRICSGFSPLTPYFCFSFVSIVKALVVEPAAVFLDLCDLKQNWQLFNCSIRPFTDFIASYFWWQKTWKTSRVHSQLMYFSLFVPAGHRGGFFRPLESSFFWFFATSRLLRKVSKLLWQGVGHWSRTSWRAYASSFSQWLI